MQWEILSELFEYQFYLVGLLLMPLIVQVKIIRSLVIVLWELFLSNFSPAKTGGNGSLFIPVSIDWMQSWDHNILLLRKNLNADSEYSLPRNYELNLIFSTIKWGRLIVGGMTQGGWERNICSAASQFLPNEIPVVLSILSAQVLQLC